MHISLLLCFWINPAFKLMNSYDLLLKMASVSEVYKTATVSQNWGWDGKNPLEVIMSSPHCSSWATYRLVPRTISKWLLNISKDGKATSSQGNLWKYSVILTAKCFLMFTGNTTFFVLACSHCLLSYNWGARKWAWFPFLYTLPSGIYTLINTTSESFLLQT